MSNFNPSEEWLRYFNVKDMRRIHCSVAMNILIQSLRPSMQPWEEIYAFSLRMGELTLYSQTSLFIFTNPGGPCMVHGTMFLVSNVFHHYEETCALQKRLPLEACSGDSDREAG